MKELNFVKNIDRLLQEKKSDFDNLNKSGLALAKLCNKSIDAASNESNGVSRETSATLHIKKLVEASNNRYDLFKKLVKKKKDELEGLLWKSAEFSERLENLTNNLIIAEETIEYAEPISAHPDKIRQQLEDNRMLILDLVKRRKALEDLKSQAQTMSNVSLENLASANHIENANDILREIDQKIQDLDTACNRVKVISEDRTKLLEETLVYSENFWSDAHDINDIINDLEDRVKLIENEAVAMDPDSLNEQQQLHEHILREINGTEEHVDLVKTTGEKLITLCGKPDQAEIQKTVEEIDSSWDRVKQMVRDREEELQDTFGKACDFQQQLIDVLEWINTQQEKFSNLDSNYAPGDSKTIRYQINLLHEFKEQIDPKQLDVQLLNQQFSDLMTNIKTNQSLEVLEALQEPLQNANREWKRLQNSIVEKKSSLQNALLSMGRFHEALEETLKWLNGANSSLDDICVTDLNEVKLIDIELARLKVLQNDIRAQEQTV